MTDVPGRTGAQPAPPAEAGPESNATTEACDYRTRILDALSKYRISARALGVRAGLAPDTIGKILNGDVDRPHRRTQLALDRRFGIRPMAEDEPVGEPLIPRSRGALLALSVPERLRALFLDAFPTNREFLDVATLGHEQTEEYLRVLQKLAAAGPKRLAPALRRFPVDAGIARLSRSPKLDGGVVAFKLEMGAWRIELDRGRGADSALLLACYAPGGPAQNDSKSTIVVCANRRGLVRFLEILAGQANVRRREMPRRGTWVARQDSRGLFFEPARAAKATEIERYRQLPDYQVVEDDVAAFFDDIAAYEDADQVPFRKFCMIGAPGTGKTSIAKALLDRFRSRMPTFIVDKFYDLHALLQQSERAKRRFLVYGEEIDALMGQASQDELAVLDGIKTPRTPGCYALFSTNFPEMIDPRVRERPGRIDTLYDVAPMQGEIAVDIFATLTPIEPADRVAIAAVLSQTTISELKEIAFRVRKSQGSAARKEGKAARADAVLAARRMLVESLRAGQAATSQGGNRVKPGEKGAKTQMASYNPSARADAALGTVQQVELRMSEDKAPPGTARPVADNPWAGPPGKSDGEAA